MDPYNIRSSSREGRNGRPVSIKSIGETRQRERVRKSNKDDTIASSQGTNQLQATRSRSPRQKEGGIERLFATTKDFFPSSQREQQWNPGTGLTDVEEEEKCVSSKPAKIAFPPIQKMHSGSKLDAYGQGDSSAR